MTPQRGSRASRASITEVVADPELVVSLGDERPHVKCCVLDVFYCRRPFHPELVASNQDDEDDCCQDCIEIMYNTMCPPVKPTHEHCPLNMLRICGSG